MDDVQNDLGAMEIDAKRAGGLGGGPATSPDAVVVTNPDVMARRAFPAPTYSPVPFGFAVTSFFLVAAILTEGVVNLSNLLVYFVVRKRVQDSCRRVILGTAPANTSGFTGTKPRSRTSPRNPRIGLGCFLMLSIALLACSSCRTIERDWEDTTWTLGVLADPSGDLESLADSLSVFVEVEPIGELGWSLDAMTGVTSVKDDSESLVWTFEKFFDWESDKYALWEILTLLGR